MQRMRNYCFVRLILAVPFGIPLSYARCFKVVGFLSIAYLKPLFQFCNEVLHDCLRLQNGPL